MFSPSLAVDERADVEDDAIGSEERTAWQISMECIVSLLSHVSVLVCSSLVAYPEDLPINGNAYSSPPDVFVSLITRDLPRSPTPFRVNVLLPNQD